MEKQSLKHTKTLIYFLCSLLVSVTSTFLSRGIFCANQAPLNRLLSNLENKNHFPDRFYQLHKMEGHLFFFVSNTEIKGAKKKKAFNVCAVTDWKFMGLGATFKKT